jgi:hypothetical protein
MLNPEIKAALKAAHPDTKLHLVRISNDIFVLRKPSHVEWSRAEEDNSASATKNLVMTCVVYPDEKAFERLLEDKYAIHRPLADVIGRLVGLEKAEEVEVF